MSRDLVVHGMPGSQPVRSVVWTCLLKQLAFELRPNDPSPEGRVPLLALNPAGQVPTIEDGDFVLYEMPAILTYLCEKHGWSDLLPADLEARAKVHQYLHFHHNWTRRLSSELMAPFVIVAFLDALRERDHLRAVVERAEAPDKLELGQKAARQVCELLEAGYLRDGQRYLCTPELSIADIACYEEVAQLRWAGLFEFDAFPRLHAWLEAMAELPFHREVHLYNTTLGDIRTQTTTVERMVAAGSACVAALAGCGVRVPGS